MVKKLFEYLVVGSGGVVSLFSCEWLITKTKYPNGGEIVFLRAYFSEYRYLTFYTLVRVLEIGKFTAFLEVPYTPFCKLTIRQKA